MSKYDSSDHVKFYIGVDGGDDGLLPTALHTQASARDRLELRGMRRGRDEGKGPQICSLSA